jgi:hypothetical protein
MSFQDLTGCLDSGTLSKRGRGRPLGDNPNEDALRMRRYYDRVRSTNGGRLKPRKVFRTAKTCDGIQVRCGFRELPYQGLPSKREIKEMDAACDRFFASRGIKWVSMTMAQIISFDREMAIRRRAS